MFLAIREMRRAKVRFGLLIVAVGLLVFLTLFLQTLLGNLLSYFTGALEHQSGVVVVYGDDARKNLSGSVVTFEQLSQVQAIPGVAQAGPLGAGAFTVRATPSGKTEAKELDTFFFGYEPGSPGAPTTLTRGRLPQSANEAVASALDVNAGLDLGDRIEVVPGSTAAQPLQITIVGLATDIRFSVQPTLFVTYATYVNARRVTNPDAAGQPVLPSAIVATPAPGVTAQTVSDRINDNVDGVEALTRTEAVASLPGVSSVSQSFSILIALTVLVVFMVTAFFFLILTVQKSAAFTLLRATGAPVRYLQRALLLQVTVVLLGGFLVGVAFLGTAATFSSDSFPITVDATASLSYAVVIVFLGFLGSAISLRRISKLQPAHAASMPSLGGLA
jgi:putative ABC transport system permease protein